ncbi:hypothetical protein BDF20DRAFT_848713 [Mycotypha africana]|uniref:uncharacterized protein n=1 Tax=Mycotypha africana TaxID=64632 RepID=UPI002301CCFD|nr:uncharacterized protein BDF20DRAFT_848713 [Mycotypha africana]KAI8992171.1 hypothetical protein BDF20DRAFT_848713 [Mycotypha africana]
MLANYSKKFFLNNLSTKSYFSNQLLARVMSTTVNAAAEREKTVVENLKDVLKTVEEFKTHPSARLVAVSKYMPAEDISYAMKTGQIHFGESYAAELEEKSKNLPSNIAWHFIGHLQTNKCKIVAKIPNLFAVETIESEKKADALNKACVNVGRKDKLRVYVQINTSGEESKSGCEPEETYKVCKHIKENCPALELYGLMTIGMKDRDAANNPDFKKIVELKEDIKSRLELDHFEASFGMSGDYIEALKLGSDNVRVGSAIFGPRRIKQ